jgi:SAM-dependent methyltransferase
MMDKDNNKGIWYKGLLICPDCSGSLLITTGVVGCSSCSYQRPIQRPLDLRPVNPAPDTISMLRIEKEAPSAHLEHIVIERPAVTYNGPQAQRDSRELMSIIQCFVASGGAVLDLGCGPRDQAVPLQYLGYCYVGVDISGSSADLLADAHALPFRDEAFECVLSYAALEHFHAPYIVIREIERVLTPGGIFVGTVSQGDPFHSSYFHMTPWGLIKLVENAEKLRILRLWDSMDTLSSLARIGRYPKIIRGVLKVVDLIHASMPFLAPRRLRWPEREKNLDRLFRGGSICFVIQKAG